MKINKKEYLIGIDTETCNGLISEDGKLDLTQSLVYDVGWIVTDKKGKVYRKRSFVIAEIFLDSELMEKAFYSDKIPKYWAEIAEGKRTLASFEKIRRTFLGDRKYFNCKVVFAHNAIFDYRALNNTIRLLTGSDKRWFMPYCVEWWDTLKMARAIFSKDKQYTKYCEENNYLTAHKHPQNRLTAEILWRYISNDPYFVESHTGLEDVEIEKEILAYCLKTNCEIRKALFEKKRAS